MSRWTLAQKILAWSLTLIASISLILFFSLRSLIGERIVGLIRQEMRSSMALVRQTLAVEGDSLLRECQVASDAPKVKAAIATADPPTVRNVLVTFMPILHCDFILVADSQGHVLGQVGTVQPESQMQNLHLLRDALQGRAGLGYWGAADVVYRMAAQPVILGDRLLGSMLVGFAFNRERCEALEKLISGPVCLARDSHVLLGTAPEPLQRSLESVGAKPEIRYQGQLYVLDDMPLASADAAGLHLVFLRSLDAYTRFLSIVQWILAVTALLTSLLAGLVSLFISRNITRPLRGFIKAIAIGGEGVIRPPQVRLHSTDGDVASLEESFNHLSMALAGSLQAWEDSFNSITEALFLLDQAGNVTRSNRTAEALATACGQTTQELCATMLRPADGLVEARLPGSDRIFLQSQSPLLDGQGRRIGTVLVLQDITDLQALREQVAQKENLAALGQAMASVSHELGLPLGSIVTHAQALSAQVFGRQARPQVDALLGEAQRAVQVVQNMLTFCGQRKLERQPLDVHQLIRETLAMRHAEMEAAGIEVQLQLSAASSWVEGERFGLRQVLLNLLLNAEDATGPAIYIRTRNDSRGGLFIQVEDSGGGVADEVLPRIFDSFFTTKPAGKGTGLGLAICRTIVQEHGGCLVAGNSEEGGALFSLWLPAAFALSAAGSPTVALPEVKLDMGDILNWRYRLVKKVGQGGMGSVYLAEDQLLGGKQVAIKQIELSSDQTGERFQKEAELLAKMDHPSLVPVSDFFLRGQHAFLVMGYVEGVTLEEVISQPPLPPLSDALDWISQVCEVLSYLHQQSPPVLMRDLKPGNLMLDTRGRMRLIDFGLARRFSADTRTTTGDRGYLTPGYAPVEQYSGTSGTDVSSDIYSLGATFYALITGTAPPESVKMMLGEERLRPPSGLRAGVSAELEQVVLRMMALHKADRYQSVAEVQEALGRMTLTAG